jgi:hypothetical protein
MIGVLSEAGRLHFFFPLLIIAGNQSTKLCSSILSS